MPREAIVEKFSADMGRSVVRVPLAERREALESLPWVEQAHVQRVLPNRIRVEITERTPVAFLRTGERSFAGGRARRDSRPARRRGVPVSGGGRHSGNPCPARRASSA